MDVEHRRVVRLTRHAADQGRLDLALTVRIGPQRNRVLLVALAQLVGDPVRHSHSSFGQGRRVQQYGTVTETREIQRTLDLALRVGDMLLANGAGAADVTATMSSIAHHLGLRQALVDVTFTTVSMSYQPTPDDPAVALIRHVKQRETDFDDLTRADHLVRDLLSDEIDIEEARVRLAQISSTGHRTPRWAVTLSWGAIGAGVALLIGGDWVVTLIAAVAAAGLEVLQRYLTRLRLPFFYAQVAGGLFASLLAVGTSAAGIDGQPFARHHREHRDAARRARLHRRDPGRVDGLLPDGRCPHPRGHDLDGRGHRRREWRSHGRPDPRSRHRARPARGRALTPSPCRDRRRR